MGRTGRDGAVVGDRIEFLPPRESLFGSDGPAEFAGIDVDDLPELDDRTPRSDWLTGAAALAVVALIAVGIIAAAPWDGTSAPPATVPLTSVPLTTVPLAGAASVAAARPQAVAPVTGYVFDPLPAGFAIRGAWRDNSDRVEAPIPGWGEVWATSDATATGGSWFSLTLLNHRLEGISQNATRVDLGGRVGLLERRDDGTLRLSAPVGQTDISQSLTISSFGRSADDLTALFTSIGIDADRPQLVDDRPTYLDPTQLDGFERIASRATDQDLIDTYLAVTPNSSTYYATGTGTNTANTSIAVTTAVRDDELESVGRLAIGPVRIFPNSSSVPSTFTGDNLVLGVSPSGADAEIIARWHDGDTTVVVRSTVPLGDLLGLLPTLRPTSEGEWSAVVRRVDETDDTSTGDASNNVVNAGGGTQFGSGTFGDGTAWTASIQPPDVATVEFDGTAAFFLLPDGTDGDGPIQAWSSGSTTVVTAITGPASAATTLRVMIDGRIIGEVAITDLAATDRTSSFAGRAGAFGFQQTGPFEVDLLAADHTVVNHLSSPGAAP